MIATINATTKNTEANTFALALAWLFSTFNPKPEALITRKEIVLRTDKRMAPLPLAIE